MRIKERSISLKKERCNEGFTFTCFEVEMFQNLISNNYFQSWSCGELTNMSQKFKYNFTVSVWSSGILNAYIEYCGIWNDPYPILVQNILFF